MSRPAISVLAALLCAACDTVPAGVTSPSPQAPAGDAAFPAASAPTGSTPAGGVPEEGTVPSVADPAFERFRAGLLQRCQTKARDPTTADMVAAGHATGSCLHDTVSNQFRKLPPRTRSGFTVGPADPIDTNDWSPAWSRLVDAVCAVEDARMFLDRIKRAAGSMRYVESALCAHAPYIEASYLLQALAKADPIAYETRVRATAPHGRRVLWAVRQALPSAERLRLLAPEDSLFNDECWMCVLADSDWRRMSLRLRAIDSESESLGTAICNVWPELAGRLGNECAEAVQEHFASYLAEGANSEQRVTDFEQWVAAFGKDIGAHDYRGLPPPKDAGYRQVIEPIIDECRRNENLHYSSFEYETRYLTCLKRHFAGLAATASRWRDAHARWNRFEHLLCRVEHGAFATDLVDVPVDRMEGLLTFTVRDLQCPALLAARGIYVVEALAKDDAEAFAAHVKKRVEWLPTLEKGMALVEEASKVRPCARGAYPASDGCRSRRLSAREWDELVRGLQQLPREAASLGKSLCEEWPTLRVQLPGCADQMRDYFVSYATFLGLLAVKVDARP